MIHFTLVIHYNGRMEKTLWQKYFKMRCKSLMVIFLNCKLRFCKSMLISVLVACSGRFQIDYLVAASALQENSCIKDLKAISNAGRLFRRLR